jgi:WD40 repeat protein
VVGTTARWTCGGNRWKFERFNAHSVLIQVKLWNTTSGFCFVTFTDHEAAVMDIAFVAGKVCNLNVTTVVRQWLWALIRFCL